MNPLKNVQLSLLDLVAVRSEPLGRGRTGVDGVADGNEVAARLARLDDVAHAEPERRDGDLAAVDTEVPVVDELARLAAAGGEPGAVDDVVEATLQAGQELVTGNTGDVSYLIEVMTELALHDAVETLDLLLHRQLLPEFALIAGRSMTMHAWRIRPTDHGALL